MRALIRIQNPPKSKKFFSTLNRGLQGARAFRGVIVSHLGEVEHPDLVSEIADFLLTYKGMERSLCTGRYKDKLHVSLRSNRLTDETPEILRDIFDDRKEAAVTTWLQAAVSTSVARIKTIPAGGTPRLCLLADSSSACVFPPKLISTNLFSTKSPVQSSKDRWRYTGYMEERSGFHGV